jgi:TPR repeat protein
MHFDGRGVAQDDKRAAALFKLAADQGYALAQYQLGGLHIYGCGVAQDDRWAAALLKLAADQGFATAQYQLGFCTLTDAV